MTKTLPDGCCGYTDKDGECCTPPMSEQNAGNGELLPCPFCGGEAVKAPSVSAGYYSYGCRSCSVFVPSHEAWNTRAPSVGAGEYVLVPREPTLAMQNAFESRYFREHAAGPEEPATSADPFSDGYRAMLHAAVQGGGQ